MDQKKSRRRRKRKTEEKMDFDVEYPPITTAIIHTAKPVLSYSSVAKNTSSLTTLDELARLGEAEMKSWS